MQSFIIASKNKKSAEDYAVSFCRKNGIDVLDIEINNFEKAVGIDDIRNMQKNLYFRPLKSKSRAVIVQSFEGLTIEAQNSLLKILEEPPPNLFIIIIVLNREILLSTILSRCKIIELKDEGFKLIGEEASQYPRLLKSLAKKGIGERLKLASDLAKNKEEACLWLEKAILAERKTLVASFDHPTSSVAPNLNILKSLQKTYTLLKNTNANERLALENLFLSF